jgi:hypothetical protein
VIGVPPADGPETTSIDRMVRCESSEVLPVGSVAVAEMRRPSLVAAGQWTSKSACPLASVVVCEVPSNDRLQQLARKVGAHRVPVEVQVYGRRRRAVELRRIDAQVVARVGSPTR